MEDFVCLLVDSTIDSNTINFNVVYKDFMSGKLDASDHRHDLGSHNDQKIKGQENITQIMWPSLYFQKVVGQFIYGLTL